MGYAFAAAIRITYGDRDDGNEDSRDGARSAVKSGGYCAAKTTPLFKTLALSWINHPLRPAAIKRRKQIDHCAPFTQRNPRPWLIDDRRGLLEAGLLEIS